MNRVSDFIAGVVFCIISALIFEVSLGYIGQTMKNGLPYYQSAGFSPAVVSLILFVCACSLTGAALRSILKSMPESVVNNGSKFKYLCCVMFDSLCVMKSGSYGFLSVTGWVGFYIFILLEFLSYVSATCVFLFVFMVFFHIKEKIYISAKKGVILLLTAFLMAQVLSFMFKDLAQIPLPGIL